MISPINNHLLDPTTPSSLRGACVPATAGTHAELLVYTTIMLLYYYYLVQQYSTFQTETFHLDPISIFHGRGHVSADLTKLLQIRRRQLCEFDRREWLILS